MGRKKNFAIMVCGLLFSNLSFAQANSSRCDCGLTFQNEKFTFKDLKKVGACKATIEISPIRMSGSDITDYQIDANVNTDQCSLIHYKIYSYDETQEIFTKSSHKKGQIHVVDGSHSERIDGSAYSATPRIDVAVCTVCTDKKYQIEPTPEPVDRKHSSLLPIFRSTPIYPRRAAERGLCGNVDLELTVDTYGRTRDINVIGSTNRLFNASAIAAAKKYIYEPPSAEDGTIIEVPNVHIKIVYVIEPRCRAPRH